MYSSKYLLEKDDSITTEPKLISATKINFDIKLLWFNFLLT